MCARWSASEKTFLITGAATGLGALYTEWFLREGAKSIAVLDLAEEKGVTLTATLNKTYPEKVFFYKCDVGNVTELTSVFNQVKNKFGKIDVIINNAGIMNDSTDMWKKSTDVNVQGLISLTLSAVDHMRRDGGGAGGTIINVSSVVALVRYPYLPIYSSSKAAVHHFSQCIAQEPFYEQTGVRILVFCLAPTDTNMLKQEEIKYKSWDLKSGIPFEDNIATKLIKQKPESAADAVVKMFKEGTNGSVWLSMSDKPAKDITPTIEAAYKCFEELIA